MVMLSIPALPLFAFTLFHAFSRFCWSHILCMRANALNLSWYCWFHFFIYCLHRFWLPAVVPLSSHTVTRERFIAILALLTLLVSSFNPIGVIVLFTSTLSRLELLCSAGFYPHTVAPCIHRCRFCVSSALPSSLLWVLPTSHNALVCLSLQVIARLPIPLQLSSLTQKHVGF